MAVLSVLAGIGIWWVSTHGKGTAPGRLVAWLLAAIIFLVLIGFVSPDLAGGIFANFARGIHQAANGIVSFFHTL